MRHYSGSTTPMLPLCLSIFAFLLPPHIPAQQPKRGSPERTREQAASNARFTAGRSALNIPLEIDNNIVLIKVSVNGSKPLRFIFDTGASHSVISSARAGELGLKAEGEFGGIATGGAIKGSYTTGVSLKVPGAEVSNQLIAIIPFPEIPGFELDGTIGYDFINEFVIEIDYQKKIMNLYDPRTYSYRGRGEVIPLLLAGRRTPLAHVTMTPPTNAPVNATLEVDTGADRAFILNSPFVKKHKLLSAMTDTTESAGRGAGGEQKIVVGRAKTVQMGRFLFANPTVGLILDSEGAGAAEDNDGVIGGEVFRRFKVIIDYSRQRMIFEPNKDFNDPYPVEPGE